MIRLLCLVMCTFMFFQVAGQSVVEKEINQNWKFRQARLANWYPAKVPGIIHTDLLSNGIIEDPFYRLNERSVQWIDKEDWIYETTLPLDKELLEKKNLRLLFYGLDTYTDVFLNGEKILSTDNMFREWKTDIKDKLRSDSANVLRIYFHSPIKVDMPKWDSTTIPYYAGNDQSENGGVFNKKMSIFARKAGYHYGWDWGPRLVTSGIWRPIILQGWDDVTIENIFFHQPVVNTKKAVINSKIEITSDRALQNIKVRVSDKKNNKSFAEKVVSLKKGLNLIEVPFTITSPKLWWCNGLGEPYLYQFKTDILADSKIADSKVDEIGLRSVTIINKPDQYGKSFYVELNGRPVFAKGVNYIPNDVFVPRVPVSKYEKIIKDVVDANMNMVRVWGGGIYENNIFYDLCDKNGIMVWQDFMFSSSMYPAEGYLLENMRLEAIDNVRRLRNHPSIALWCGNNESYESWIQNRKWHPAEEVKVVQKQLDDQYLVMLPKVVKEHAPGAFYWPSSPFSEPEKIASDSSGDRHYWDVWHGKKPIENYNKERSRFFSEYGFQSFPDFQTVKLYAPKPEDWDIYSEVMMSHQRGGAHANRLIETYLLNEYQKPKDFQSFLYMNHVLQADVIKTAIEAHRRDMPFCMGTLYWQLNDVWPVASWSGIDYYGRWKALHYFVKEAYRDILISPIAKDNVLNVFVVSDRKSAAKGVLDINVMKLTGGIINQYKQNVKAQANQSHIIFTIALPELLKNNKKEDVVINAVLTLKSGETYSNNYVLVKQKEVNYPHVNIQRSIEKTKDGFNVTLTSGNFARAVFLSLEGIDHFFDKNYFDILPGQSKAVNVRSGLSLQEFSKQLKIVSLVDGYK